MHLPDLLSIFTHMATPVAYAAEEAAAEATNPGVAGMFGLNVQLFVAQLVNFAIVLFVLWKWVFKPVAKAMTERTNKIEASLTEAKRITEEKETFETWKTGEINKVRVEASHIITEAKQEAESVRHQITEKAKQDQAQIILQTQAKLEEEKQKALTEIKGQVADIVVTATEKIIRGKLDDKKDKELIDQALEQAQA